MKLNLVSKFGASLLALSLAVVTSQAALTTTYITDGVTDGGGNGTATGDTVNGVGAVTLSDNTSGGDMWEGGDQAMYLHSSARITGDFTATARIIGQTEAANGRWGKTGIQARNDLTFTSASAMAQAAAGNDSQPGGVNPVANRLGGRVGQGLTGANTMFEIDIAGSPNNTFLTDGGVNKTWVSLSYDADTNGFIAGFAPDVADAPGTWTFSPVKTDVPDSNPLDGWYVGLVYSAHADMSLGNPAVEGMHGVTFDNFSIIPEPSTALLGVAGVGALALRRRRRS